jgi:hypothetical protein
MAEFTFSCPGCGSGILCDSQWSGHQIACPTCQAAVIVPEAVAPAPTPAASTAAAAAAARARISARTQGAPKSTGKIVAYVIIGLIAAGGFFYVMKRAGAVDTNIAESTTKAAKESGGGDLGHMAELYDVLDKTDPDHMGMSSKEAKLAKEEEAKYKQRIAARQADRAKAEAEAARLANAEWKMDIESAEIPGGRANGMLSGTNFVAEVARIDRAGYAQVLTLRHVEGSAVLGEIFIYLTITPNETVTNRTWTITQDMKGKGVPQIIKRWKPNPRYALTQKSFSTGYAMKLEIGAPTDEGTIPGKVMLSLPDAEKSYVAGEFQAETVLYQSARANYDGDVETMIRKIRKSQ